MSDVVNGTPVGANETATSGAVENQQQQVQGANPHVEKLLKERNNYKARALESEAKLKSFEEKSLIENEEFKTLAESKTKELEEERKEKQRLLDLVATGKKTAALKSELAKLGIGETYVNQAVKLANLDDIKVDSEFNAVVGADAVAQSIKEAVPVLFGSNERVSNSAPEGTTEKLTLEAYKKLSPEDKKKRRAELEANLGITTGLTRLSSR
jgi:hypothetical protein